MRDAIAEMLQSKKFLASIAGALAALVIKLAGRWGWALDPATANELAQLVVASCAAYVLSQGLADHGKEAAQIHADAQADAREGATPVVPTPLPGGERKL